VLVPGPEQLLDVSVLLPVFPWPLVVSVVVVVWLFVLLPTLVVLVEVQVATPLTFVNVPPLDVHCCSEDAAKAAGLAAISGTDARSKTAAKRFILTSLAFLAFSADVISALPDHGRRYRTGTHYESCSIGIRMLPKSRLDS
jgi:hypothetical protein